MTDTPPPAHKKNPSAAQRALRLVLSSLDPRAWAHVFRLVNYYNYTHVTPRRKLRLGPGARISPTVDFSNAERIVAGRGLRLGARCHLWAGNATGRIVIGDDVLFGPEVLVTASGYRFNDGTPVTDQAMDEADVVIGDDVWIGARAILLPGARIGAGAIIAAGRGGARRDPRDGDRGGGSGPGGRPAAAAGRAGAGAGRGLTPFQPRLRASRSCISWRSAAS